MRSRRGKVWCLHLEQAETGLDTLKSGVSAALGPERVIFAILLPELRVQVVLKAVSIPQFPSPSLRLFWRLRQSRAKMSPRPAGTSSGGTRDGKASALCGHVVL